MKKLNIAIFTGGDSSEHVISLKSAEQVYKWLREAGHQCYIVEIKKSSWTVHIGKKKVPLDKNNLSVMNKGERISFDFIWNTIHGTPGEDGKLQ